MAGRCALFGDSLLRRGRATDDVFARARSCVRRTRSLPGHADIMRGDSRTIESEEPCTVDEARRVFDEERRARMSVLEGGRYTFRVAYPSSDEVYVLQT